MKIINTSKKVSFNYEKIEQYEAGIVLTGYEVKSIRNKHVNLTGSFCKFVKNELFVFDMHISKFEQANSFYEINETRSRKILLKKKELAKIRKSLDQDGTTIIPYMIYFKDKCKLELLLAKGKSSYDKRQSIKEKDLKREKEREYAC